MIRKASYFIDLNALPQEYLLPDPIFPFVYFYKNSFFF